VSEKPERPATSAATLPTDIAEPRAKLFAGALAVVERIDTGSIDQVFDLASALQHADTRRIMQATHEELRAICAAAVRDGTIASHACRLAALVDSDATVADIVAQREALYAAVRASGLTLQGAPTDGKA
jgi:hypothetical protein